MESDEVSKSTTETIYNLKTSNEDLATILKQKETDFEEIKLKNSKLEKELKNTNFAIEKVT